MGFSGSAEIAVRECMPNGVWFFVIKNRHIICMRKADGFLSSSRVAPQDYLSPHFLQGQFFYSSAKQNQYYSKRGKQK